LTLEPDLRQPTFDNLKPFKMAPSNRPHGIFLLFLAFFSFSTSLARDTKYIFGTDAHGVTQRLAVDRYPALYTGDFGDCLGGQSLFNITKFDAAYYADNLTVVFHLDGHTSIKNESLMCKLGSTPSDDATMLTGCQ
jgi:hypothetical protein